MGMLTTNMTPLTAIRALRPIQSASSPAKSGEITLPNKTAANTMESSARFNPDVASR